MLEQGIIEESSSPWMAPAVFVRKSGDLRLCVDYRELNKTTKDAYPLPLPDEVQDRLSGSTGLIGAPSSFQRLMDSVLRGLSFVTIYLDDILVHSATEEEHSHLLQEVFQRLADAGLTLRGRKCHIGMAKVPYLGHVFSGSGMHPDPKKVQRVQELPVPTDTTEVRQFLGLASYYRRYIHRFSDIAAPLNALTNKGVPFSWNQDCK